MFTQPCFIEKNTEELRDRLYKLGYKHIQSIIKNRNEMIFANMGYFSNNFPYNAMLIDTSIDCGTNELLFLAIAALRDDTDRNQWFVHKSGAYWWLCSDFDSFKEDFESSNEDEELKFEDYHKATVKELIEFFKDK